MTVAALARETERALLAFALYCVATCRPHRLEGHVLDATQRGATPEQLDHALDLRVRLYPIPTPEGTDPR